MPASIHVFPGDTMGFLWAIYTFFLHPILVLLFWVFIAYVIVSWLLAFGILNQSNPNARAIVRFLDRICEPLCRPVRKVIPPIGGLDLSVLVVVLAIRFVDLWLLPTVIASIAGAPGL